MFVCRHDLFNTVKPAHAVTSIKQSPVLNVTFFLSCHRKFHMNLTSFKRSPFLQGRLFIVPRVISSYRFDILYALTTTQTNDFVCD